MLQGAHSGSKLGSRLLSRARWRKTMLTQTRCIGISPVEPLRGDRQRGDTTENKPTWNPTWNLNGHLVTYWSFNIVHMCSILRYFFKTRFYRQVLPTISFKTFSGWPSNLGGNCTACGRALQSTEVVRDIKHSVGHFQGIAMKIWNNFSKKNG